MKKLPTLYTNTFNKKIDNSLDYIKISSNDLIERKIDTYTLKNKIDNIFKSKNYIYKIKVEINFNNSKRIETIIGKNKNNLITINNELININDIIDIKETN